MSSRHQRKLDAAKARRQRRAELAKAMATVYQVIPERTLTDGLKLAVKLGSEARCVMRLMFAPKTLDFYIALPYLKVNAYRAGLATAERDRPTTFDVTIGTDEARVPFKLSYHESGQVHFKPQSSGGSERGQASIQATPIRYFDGSHVFTLELEGLLNFDKPKERDYKRPSFLVYDLAQPQIERLKIIGYAGFASEVVSGKYTAKGQPLPPNLLLKMQRPDYTAPLYLGLYFQLGPSISQSADARSFELLISGFNKDSGSFIFTQAALLTRS